MKFKFIFCILSSKNLSENNEYFNSNNKYEQIKNFIDKYFNNFKDDIKYFLIEYNNLINDEICEQNEYIYVKGFESIIPGMLDKFKKAVKHINSNYEYDFLIHTNLTSLWNLYNLLLLYPKLPKNDFFGGHLMFNLFITGTGIILSKDLTHNLLLINDNSVNNDIAISIFFLNKIDHFYTFNDSSCHKLNFQIEDTNCTDINSVHHPSRNIIPNDIENILYFRIKTDNVEKDIYLTKYLINKIYNINL
jgi:hypothetical protein